MHWRFCRVLRSQLLDVHYQRVDGRRLRARPISISRWFQRSLERVDCRIQLNDNHHSQCIYLFSCSICHRHWKNDWTWRIMSCWHVQGNLESILMMSLLHRTKRLPKQAAGRYLIPPSLVSNWPEIFQNRWSVEVTRAPPLPIHPPGCETVVVHVHRETERVDLIGSWQQSGTRFKDYYLPDDHSHDEDCPCIGLTEAHYDVSLNCRPIWSNLFLACDVEQLLLAKRCIALFNIADTLPTGLAMKEADLSRGWVIM